MWSAIKFTIRESFKASKRFLLLGVITQIIIALSSIVNTFTFKEIIDAANNQATILGLSIFGVVFVRLIYEIFKKILEGYSTYTLNQFDAELILYANKKFIKKISTLDLTTFENPHQVGLIQRAFSRLQFQFKYYILAIVGVTSSLIELAVATGIFFLASPLVALLIIVANVIPIWVRTKLSYGQFLIYKANDESKRKFGYSFDILTERSTLPEVKINQAFDFFSYRISSIYRQFTRKQLAIEKKYQIVNSAVELLPIFAIFIFSIYISIQLIQKDLSVGMFVFLFTNVFVFAGALDKLGQNLGQLDSDKHFVNEIIEFFELRPKIEFPTLVLSTKDLLIRQLKNPEITLEKVSFKYPNSKQFALQDISLTIPYGQNLALIGENGAGKTTFVKQLLRMYDPLEGKILINGIDLKEIPEELLFNLYSTLFQDFGRFCLTVKENLEFSAGKKLSDQEMVNYLKFSNAWEFISQTQNKLNQQLGPEYTDGTDLSGGQWQRLAIARAYAKKAPILILDEPTSAVDARSEMEIFDRINHQMEENTLIFISHRFSTIKDAQRIVVLDKGKVVEDGTHSSLIKANRKYAHLYTIQAERFKRK